MFYDHMNCHADMLIIHLLANQEGVILNEVYGNNIKPPSKMYERVPCSLNDSSKHTISVIGLVAYARYVN
ncbi:TPA: hypothetical protein ACKOR7_000269 [Clostridioides difficile]